MRKEIKHGEIIPKWYGVAWLEYNRDVAVCIPIPLNVIAAAFRYAWIWLKHGHRLKVFSLADAYHQGFEDGKNFRESE